MEIELRRASTDDLAAIQDLFAGTIMEVCRKDYNMDQLKVWAAGAQDELRWTAKIEEQFFLVATRADQIVGFGSLKNGDYIDLMYVHKDHQKQGIAHILLKALENQARKMGSQVLRSEASKTARPFFERNGFHVITRQTIIVDSVRIGNYKMEKRL